jgi:hypothetical protein
MPIAGKFFGARYKITITFPPFIAALYDHRGVYLLWFFHNGLDHAVAESSFQPMRRFHETSYTMHNEDLTAFTGVQPSRSDRLLGRRRPYGSYNKHIFLSKCSGGTWSLWLRRWPNGRSVQKSIANQKTQRQ